MSKNYFKSYIWLLGALQSHGNLTLKELQSLWMKSSVNDDGKPLAPRTLFNHIESIADMFGIDIECDRVYPDMKPVSVVVKTDAMQANYFRSLPLHPSQEEVESGEDYAVFRYFLTPDYDFKQDLLSFGENVEVLEPASLREEFRNTINQLMKVYGKDN